MGYAGEIECQATDARTNEYVPPVDFEVRGPGDMAKLKALWADMPSVPKLLMNRRDGEDASWPGFDMRTLLRGEESSGRWSFHSLILAPGAGLPAHALDGSSVYWWLIDGEVEVTVGTATETLRGRAFAFVPEQTTQAIWNRSSKPAELFIGYTPAGADHAFAAAHRLAQTSAADAPAFLNLLETHGFRFTGGAAAPNDARTNAKAPRLDLNVQKLEDYLELRRRWGKLPPVPKIVPDLRACRNIPVGGGETRVILDPEESAGQASVFLNGLDKGVGAPPHHQPEEEEVFFVLDGPLVLTIGNKTVEEVPAGAFGFAPRFGTHAFANTNDSKLSVLSLNSPGGHDRGFEAAVREGGSPGFGALITAHGFQFHVALPGD